MSALDKVNKDYRYSAEHEWIDSSSPAKVGLSQIAVDALGEVVYVDLPSVGQTVTAGEVCGEIESTKSVGELYAPVGGEGHGGVLVAEAAHAGACIGRQRARFRDVVIKHVVAVRVAEDA